MPFEHLVLSADNKYYSMCLFFRHIQRLEAQLQDCSPALRLGSKRHAGANFRACGESGRPCGMDVANREGTATDKVPAMLSADYLSHTA